MPAKPRPEPLPLYPSEERIVREVFGDAASVMMKSWRETAVILERNGLPKRDPLFGSRRYWPAVERWLKSYNGISSEPGAQAPDGEENF
jgi:hypothetical protein